jgi:hypothetical protein
MAIIMEALHPLTLHAGGWWSGRLLSLTFKTAPGMGCRKAFAGQCFHGVSGLAGLDSAFIF